MKIELTVEEIDNLISCIECLDFPDELDNQLYDKLSEALKNANN